MFVWPGIVLDAPWTDEVARVFQQDSPQARAAVFRRSPANAGLGEWLLRAGALFGALPRPDQGLLIARALYDSLGGHSSRARDPERDFLRRLGRRRIARLATHAFGSA